MKEVAENLLEMTKGSSPWKVGIEFIRMILEIFSENYPKFKFIWDSLLEKEESTYD